MRATWRRRYETGRLAYAPRMDADAVELRVLGCLIEKQRTTPDQYPLTLNSLRLACNQSTNRDPVVDYDERDIHDALATPRPTRLDAPRERAREPGGEVPAAVRPGARARRDATPCSAS